MNHRYIKSIRGKILISILAITLFTSLAVTFIFYYRSAKTIEENYISSLRQQSRQLMMQWDEELERIYHITVYASCDDKIKEEILSYIDRGRESDLEELAKRLCEYKEQSPSIASLYLLIPKKNTLVTSEEYPLYQNDISKEKQEKIIQKTKDIASPILVEDLVHEGEMLFCCAQTIESEDGEVIGYLFSNTNERKLYYDYIAGWKDKAIQKAVILNSQKIVLTGTGMEQMGDTWNEAKEYEKWLEKKEVEASNKENIYIYSSSIFTDAGLFTVVDKSVVLSDLLWIKRFFFGILAVFLAVAVILAFWLSHIIYRPLKRLTFTMEEVSDGNLQTRAEVVSRDEIGELAVKFNGMLDEIENLIERLIEEENKKKDMELEALQYQITPHFMYNTLNSIKFAALIKGEKEIGQVIGDFVELLQAAISKKGAFLTVAEEVHILENYIRLQEFRYGGGFDVSYDIEEEAQGCMVPRLILQPLVENALLHGMDMKERKGKLIISASIMGERLCLKVEDNGRGMSEEQIKILLTSKARKEKGFTAIGIPNICERLKLYYGENAKLRYESNEAGTTAIISMPARKGEE